jgi:hypothetical protein
MFLGKKLKLCMYLNILTGGSDVSIPRPFGSAILDGIDLDIGNKPSARYCGRLLISSSLPENQDSNYYSDFTNARNMRKLYV